MFWTWLYTTKKWSLKILGKYKLFDLIWIHPRLFFGVYKWFLLKVFFWRDFIQQKNYLSTGKYKLFDLIWIQTQPLFCFVRWFFIKICFWLDSIQQKNYYLSKSQQSVTVFTSFEYKRDHYIVFLGAFY